MQRTLSLKRKILAAFVGAGLLLLSAGSFAVGSAHAYVPADGEADKLRDAERALLAMELSVREAESGQRGYLLTGREEYLRPYARALHNIGGQMVSARKLLVEQPEALAVTYPGVLEMDSIRARISELQKLLQARITAELARSVQRRSLTLVGVLLAGTLVAGLAIAAYLVIAWDLRERRQLDTRIEDQADRDALTQLASRRFFERSLELAFGEAQRDGSRLGLLFVGLDGFKAVNELHGQDTSDALLVEIARRFRQASRESDLIGRLGGDEFALVVPHVRDGQELAQLAQRLLRSLGDPNQPRLADQPIGASIGIAVFPAHAANVQGLMAAADAAMYDAKRAGKNRIVFAQSSVAVAA